jgi:hypothetical protein
MNKRIKKMLREVERRGGLVSINGAIPNDVAERFLEEVLACPDCAAAKPPIDQILAGPMQPKGRNGH